MQAGAVDVLHDEEVQLLILINVVCVDDVGMIEGGDGPRLAVEAFEGRLVVRLGGGQDFDGDPATHQLVLAQVNASHAAGAELFEDFVLANGEPSPFALHDLFGLKLREQAIAHEKTGHARRIGRKGLFVPELGQVLGEASFIRHAAFTDQLQKFLGGGRCSHRVTFLLRRGRRT